MRRPTGPPPMIRTSVFLGVDMVLRGGLLLIARRKSY